jgi:hypothetical protein
LASPDVTHHVAAILNAGWMVRHYVRGGRSQIQKLRRKQAIQFLGATVREAFNASDDYEALLVAVVDGLRPKDDPPF